MNFSKKMDSFKPGIFDTLNKLRAEKIRDGHKVYDLWVGTPDFTPDSHVMKALTESSKNPENYKYSLGDMPELTQAVIDWYKRRYNVNLSADEITSANGSQEGLTHIAMPICDYNDIVLVPNPGYPIFALGPMLCGAQIVEFPLYEKNNFLIDFDDIPKETAKAAKMIVVSYPANPVTAVANKDFYKKLVAFAKRYDLIVIHDNAYSELVFDQEPGMSFLEVEGAKDVGVEFNSLSKSYNMTGLRISFCVGNKEIIQKFKAVRSQIDYGVSFIVQHAAIAALNGPQDILDDIRNKYKQRRDALCGGLRSIGWNVKDSKGSMFVWAKLPDGYDNSEKFALKLLDMSGVMCVPGSAFGSLGEGFVRFALTSDVEKINEAINSIKNCGILNNK